MLVLKLQLYFNWFSFQLISFYKPMHNFCWYFIKGEKTWFSYFNWYLYSHSLTLWLKIFKLVSYVQNENILQLVSRFMFRYSRFMFNFNWYRLFSWWWFSIDIMFLKSPLIDFVFVLDKKGENIVFYCFVWHKGEERFLPLVLFMVLITPLLMIDKKGEKDLWSFICMLMFMHILCFNLKNLKNIKFNWFIEFAL